jgi:hypothetical protein
MNIMKLRKLRSTSASDGLSQVKRALLQNKILDQVIDRHCEPQYEYYRYTPNPVDVLTVFETAR